MEPRRRDRRDGTAGRHHALAGPAGGNAELRRPAGHRRAEAGFGGVPAFGGVVGVAARQSKLLAPYAGRRGRAADPAWTLTHGQRALGPSDGRRSAAARLVLPRREHPVGSLEIPTRALSRTQSSIDGRPLGARPSGW